MLLVAACGGSDDDEGLDTAAAPVVTVGAPATEAPVVTEAPAATTAPPATTVAATAAPTTRPGVTGPNSASIIATTNSPVGTILADREARSVYAFTNDRPGQAPACVDQCAKNWPPLLVPATPTPAGSIDGAQLGTVARADGSTQATYAGHPLYYFGGDARPGDLKGQGVGGNWFALEASGQLVTAAATATVNLAATLLGDVAVDAEGRTLYIFKNDAKDGPSTCVDKCSENWPPLVIEDVAAAGQGIDGTWFASTPAGTFSGTPAAAAAAPALAAAQPFATDIENLTFEPIEIAVGAEVSWTNRDAASHTVTADDGEFDSGIATPLKKGATFTTTFSEVGTYSYHCEIHPSMQGTVTVK